jgi:SAM-dependent methyltransferase
MSGAVEQHYARLLARNYSWMSGQSVEEKAAEQLVLLRGLGVGPRLAGLAVDLGSGPGYQSFALADLGARRVLAVDTSRALLDELRACAGERPVEPVLGDIRSLPDLVDPGSVETLVCMGDTLPHLPDRAGVRRLFADAFVALQPGGQLVLTFRDLSRELEGLDRILPIRADDERIMICILYFGPKRVTVTDVVHRRENGDWTLDKGSYEKLRLSRASVAEQLSSTGFDVVTNEPAGRMQAIVARKPPAG